LIKLLNLERKKVKVKEGVYVRGDLLKSGLHERGKKKKYPEELKKYLVKKLSPLTITKLYKKRWDIEIFFKWIKQNLKIKTFLETTKNAVLTQIWIALI